MNRIEEASTLEQMAQNHEGKAALERLQGLPQEERLQVIKQLQNDAKQEGGKVYIDNGQLIFESPFPHKEYK